jgi:hypothetical protein
MVTFNVKIEGVKCAMKHCTFIAPFLSMLEIQKKKLNLRFYIEKFEDTKVVIRSRKS